MNLILLIVAAYLTPTLLLVLAVLLAELRRGRRERRRPQGIVLEFTPRKARHP